MKNPWVFVHGQKKMFLFVFISSLFWTSALMAERNFKEMYDQRCAACHSIGGGKRVGPDLAGINGRRSEGWLIQWIRSAQKLLQSGDPVAKSLFDEFKIPMPDQNLTDVEIKGILTYIKQAEGAAASALTEQSQPASVRPATQEEIDLGRNLFQGKRRFANGGPACIACHSVNNESLISGGVLARGLTTIYSRAGEQGVRAILENSPFPVMNAAFEGRPLAEEEILGLVGFLQYVDKENMLHQPREYGWAMFGAGSLGVGFLLGFYSMLGRGRKRRSVNQDIYDRQIKSE